MSTCRHDDVCEWFRERLELFLDGELSGSENFRFQQHLKECDDCGAYWSDDEMVSEQLLLQYATPLERAGALPPDPDYSPRLPRVGEERTITQHSTSVVFDRRRPLLLPGLVTAAAALILLGFVLDGPRDSTSRGSKTGAGAEQATIEPPARIYPQGRIEVRAAGGEWRPLQGAADIAAGTEVRSGRDSRILIDLGDQDHVVLGEDSSGRIDDLGSSLSFEILRGRFSCDLNDRDFRLQAAGLEVAGRDVAFDLRTAEGQVAAGYESRIAVTRGALQARSDVGAARRLVDGDVFAVRDGLLVAYDRLEDEYGEVMLATKPRADLGAGLNEAPADMAEVGGEAIAMPLASARPRIERWLNRVVAQGGLNIVDPDRSSLLMIERVAVWGESVLPDVVSLYRSAEDALARRALVGLVGEMTGQGARTFVEAAADDSDLRVRKASLLCLSRRDDPGLATHFLNVMRREQNTDLRLSAAYLAAAMGEQEGFALMREMHAAATTRYWRETVVVLAARLDQAIPGREGFLLQALESFEVVQGLSLLETLIDALAGAEDVARLGKALRSALADETLKPAMHHRLEAALRRLDP